MAEVQLDIGSQTGVGEIRRTCDHALVVGGNDKRLAMKETFLKAPDLDLARFKPSYEAAGARVGYQVEAEQVPV